MLDSESLFFLDARRTAFGRQERSAGAIRLARVCLEGP